VVEARRLRLLSKMHQANDSSHGVAIPKTPLRSVDLSQRMAANPTIGNNAYALLGRYGLYL